ncbi:hypothetical protein Q1695_016123 [Nippostrongylus brasiliensis]|nr:hypothetical protein Q1695_016123 [Nippostrongylus brasiliensis]
MSLAIISPDDDVVAGMLSFGTCGKRTKNVTAADISLPFDFRIETHIDEDTSVGEMANAIKNSSQSLRARPNILRPDPNWPTVGQRQWRDRRPLTEQELRNSVFGEQVRQMIHQKDPGSHFHTSTSGINSADSFPTVSSGTIPTTPIPRAPTRYRERLPSPWMNKSAVDLTRSDRSNSKSSLLQITQPLCVTRNCRNSCEVCKNGSISNSIYFPANAVRPSKPTTKKDVDGEEYDVILSRENTRVARPPVVDSAPATMPRRATPKPLPPNPPPRGIPVKKEKTADKPEEKPAGGLGFSPVTAITASFPDLRDEQENDSKTSGSFSFDLRHSVSSSDRPWLDSGVEEDEEVTRL